MKTQELISEAISLPIEERALIVDYLLKSLNPAESATEKKWAQEAQRRLQDLRSGKVKSVSAEKVFTDLWKRVHQ
ncbi:addiction module protein [Chlorobium ferrooxidans]|uniref:addiction module protein n=1 Tax=Chlorobium ferrooxidans TaxID=84205 RepID=UPI0002F57C64|nr:addiction module protein [Chlorobium ferrooxidans]